MGWIIFGIILTLVLFVGLGFKRNPDAGYSEFGFKWKLNPKQFFALFGMLVCLFSFISKVPANHVGIIYSPFGGTKEQTISEGFHTKNPFDKVYKISTEVQTTKIDNLTTQTKDAQYVNSTLDIKYRVNTSNAYMVFKQFRTLDKLSDTLIIPTTQRVLELITTKYNVFDILGESRADVYAELEMELKTEFAKYGVEFYTISITDMDAGEAIEKAISDEAIAKKAVETAEQNLLKVETEAKQKSVEAQATLEAAKINAETTLIQAEAENEKNRIVNEYLTDAVLQQKWLNHWDGKLPVYYGGDGADLIFDMSGTVNE